MPSSAFQTWALRSEEHTSELQSHDNLVCRLLLEKEGRGARQARDDVRGQGERAGVDGALLGGPQPPARGGRVGPLPTSPRSLANSFFFKESAPHRAFAFPRPPPLRV